MISRGLLYNDAPKTYPGYTLYCVEGITGKPSVYVLDMAGKEVHTWDIPKMGPLVKPLPKGHILALVGTDVCSSSKDNSWCQTCLREYDWDGNVVWEFKVPEGFDNFTHDAQRLLNGNTLVVAAKNRLVPEMLPLQVRDHYILEVDPSGSIVWQWSALDHFDQLGISAEGKQFIIDNKIFDVFHTNSIQSLPLNKYAATDLRFTPGNILVSQRSTNRVFIIDKANGNVVWKLDWDNIGQHHASMVPPSLQGAGNIMFFDNGGWGGFPTSYRNYSRVVEICPLNNRRMWRYRPYDLQMHDETFYSERRGSVQRLPNGNTLIVESVFGRIFEVDRNEQLVWEYVNPYFRIDQNKYNSNQIYRAYRVDTTWPTGPVGPKGNPFFW